MRTRGGLTVAVALGVSTALAACASDDQDATRYGGAAVGAAAGCGVGAAVGGEDDRTTGCMLGAALGGAAGLAVGNEIARRKDRYADWNKLLDSEIADAEHANRALAKRNEAVRAELAESNRRAAQLEAAVASGRASVRDKERELRAVRQRVAAADDALAGARAELWARWELLEEARRRADVDRDALRAYGDELAEMERRVAELDELVGRYENVGAFVEDI